MYFPVRFSRTVSGTGTALGADAAPITLPNPNAMTNLLVSPLANINGWPMQRIVVGYGSAPTGALRLPCSIYVWDDNSASWFKAAAGLLVPGELTWFDMPILCDPPATALGYASPGGMHARAGALEAYIKIDAAGGDPTGTYVFTAGSDLSNSIDTDREMESVAYSLTATSPAAAGTVAGTAITGLSDAHAIDIVMQLQNATGGTLNVYIQKSADGVLWTDYYSSVQLSSGGTTTSTVNYVPALTNDTPTVGIGTHASGTVLAAGTGAGGHWLDQLRVLFVAGSGTSAGAAQTITVNVVRPKV